MRDKFNREHGEALKKIRTTWCARQGGITGLMQTYGSATDLRLYNMLSHFAHGPIKAMQTLDGKIDNPEQWLAQMIGDTYARYLGSTRGFLSAVWGPIITSESERCKSDFLEVETVFRAVNP